MSLIIIDNVERVWNSTSADNDYSIFVHVNGSYGVYIFRDPSDGNILYIGEAREQDLKTRVTQNLTASNTGGTFRKNYMDHESSDFEGFKEFIRGKQILLITANKNILIRALESMLISVLNPKYNKEK